MPAVPITRTPFLRMHDVRVQQAEHAGTISLGYYQRYQKLNWTPFGAEVLVDISGPRISLGSLYVPPLMVRCRAFYLVELSSGLLSVCANPQELYEISESIASHALRLAEDLPPSSGYSIMADLEFLEVDTVMDSATTENFLERRAVNLDSTLVFDAMDSSPIENYPERRDANLDSVLVLDAMESAPTRSDTGASRGTIEKLIRKGSFVASESDKGLGTCSICLEELSSRETRLLRVECSHVYHRSCLLPWLEKRTTCPNCRKQLA